MEGWVGNPFRILKKALEDIDDLTKAGLSTTSYIECNGFVRAIRTAAEKALSDAKSEILPRND